MKRTFGYWSEFDDFLNDVCDRWRDGDIFLTPGIERMAPPEESSMEDEMDEWTREDEGLEWID
jgi:hypothetical protein